MRSLRRWGWALFPLAFLAWTAGYWGPWVNHKDAGLVILGIDLAEYVKFLPQIRSGEIHLWREGFYLPAFALSVGISLLAWRREISLPGWARGVATLLAFPPAFAMLPPIWTPALMFHSAEFRQQAVAIAVAVATAAVSPLLGRLPRRATATLIAAVFVASALVPIRQFLAIHPALEAIYREPLPLGYGVWLMVVGAFVLLVGCVWLVVGCVGDVGTGSRGR